MFCFPASSQITLGRLHSPAALAFFHSLNVSKISPRVSHVDPLPGLLLISFLFQLKKVTVNGPPLLLPPGLKHFNSLVFIYFIFLLQYLEKYNF